MTHLLTIDSSLSPEEVGVLVQQYALTGGYELTLKSELDSGDLQKLSEAWMPELKKYQMRDSRLFFSDAWKILNLILDSKNTPASLRSYIRNTLALTGATIFVVDDEPIMRDVTQIVIEEYGGKTIVASSGEETLAKVRELKDQISCFFIDFSMPRMDGFELYSKLLNLLPDLKVIFSSGLKPTDEISDLIRQGKAMFIAKPFDDQTLLAALRTLIAVPDTP